MKTLIQYFFVTLLTFIGLGINQVTYAADPLFGIWNGTLSNEQGEIPFELAISRNGHYVFAYTDNEVFHWLELTTVGQTVSYVPTGGGKGEVRLAYLDERVKGMTLMLEENTQQLSPTGFLNENHALTGLDMNLTDQGLETLLVMNTESNTEENGFTRGGIVLTGILQADAEFAAQYASGQNDAGDSRFFEDRVEELFNNAGQPLPDGFLVAPVFSSSSEE